ncbi:MAG: hypothetical protein LQ341_003276 [Variospora aurantia]|nr:MAG: hypothetical protein LQ341_003276 [Variospora aurantia]
MAAATRCALSVLRTVSPRPLGLRSISVSPTVASGHNRWSKIKHDKLKVDAVRSKERSQWVRTIQDVVKRSGGDPNSSAELCTLLAQAKKAGLPKEIIERSIAKGKGVSMSGLPLETVTLEAMLPPSISAIIECQTDNKNRTLGDLRLLVKNAGGTVTPTSHLFEKRGRITFDTEGENEVEEEQVMESVLEAGGLDMDVEEDQRSMTVYTEPSQTASVAQNLAGSLGVKLRNYEIVWVARPESRVEVHNLSDENHPRLEDIIGKSE